MGGYTDFIVKNAAYDIQNERLHVELYRIRDCETENHGSSIELSWGHGK